MARTCTVCSHEDLEAIDNALSGGETVGWAATKFGLGRDALFRHRRNHMAALTAVHIARPRAVLARVTAQVNRLESYADDQHRAGRGQLFLAASRELRQSMELLAKLSGELDERPTQVVNIFASAQWKSISAGLMALARNHPELQPELEAVVESAKVGSG